MHRTPIASETPSSLEEWIRSARGGSDEALGQLLEECRPYLLLVANRQLPPDLRGKAGASDMVQETFVQAQAHFDRFRDDTEPQLLAWLRQILLNHVANLNRHYRGTDKRQVARELPLLDGPSGEPFPGVAAPGPSPSSLMAAAEEDVALRRALDQLTEEQRQVVLWRNYERLAFEEIGVRLHRSAGAVRKLWVRAVERLQELLDVSNGN